MLDLHKNVYQKDIVERYKLKDDAILSALVDALSSSVGSLTNPHKLACTAASAMGKATSDHTILQATGAFAPDGEHDLQ